MRTLIPLLIAVPLLTAAVLVAINRLISRRIADTIATATAAAVTVMACLVFVQSTSHSIVYWYGGWLPRSGVAIGIAFFVDPFSGALAAFSGLLVTCAFVVSWHYFEAVGTFYHVLMLIFLSALIGFTLTGDMFTLFVFFELMSVAAYALTAYKTEASPLEGALNFAVTNTVGGYLLLFGLGLLYGRTGALNLAQMGNTLAGQPADGLMVVAFMLILCGLFTKGAVFPFHFWLDDAHAVAPTPVCILFSGVMVQSALYAIARIFWTVFSGPFSPHIPEIRTVFIVTAVVTSFVGGILCLTQRHIKRLLAFSTISHSGVMLAGFTLFEGKAVAGAAIYLFGHGMAKAALFICAGILLHKFSSVDELDLQGKAKRLKWVALFTVVGAFALCGIPPFSTFLGKSLIDESAVARSYQWLPIVLAITVGLTAGAVLRVAGRVFFGFGQVEMGEEERSPTEEETPETTPPHRRAPVVMLAPACLLLIGCIVISQVPGIASGAINWAQSFQDRTSYTHAVLGGAQELSTQPAGTVATPLSSYGYAAISLVVTLIVFALSLFRCGIPDRVRQTYAKSTDPLADLLSYLHSGYVGDYVVWQVIGFVVIGSTLAAAAL